MKKIFVLTQNPLKQGLKPEYDIMDLENGDSFDPKSIKTRIETTTGLFLKKFQNVLTQNPLKQGLKQSNCGWNGNLEGVLTQNPLKQGLKPGKTMEGIDGTGSFDPKSIKTRIETQFFSGGL